MPYMDVRPAHTNAADSHKRLARLGLWALDLPERYLARRRHHLLQHLHFFLASSSPIIFE